MSVAGKGVAYVPTVLASDVSNFDAPGMPGVLTLDSPIVTRILPNNPPPVVPTYNAPDPGFNNPAPRILDLTPSYTPPAPPAVIPAIETAPLYNNISQQAPGTNDTAPINIAKLFNPTPATTMIQLQPQTLSADISADVVSGAVNPGINNNTFFGNSGALSLSDPASTVTVNTQNQPTRPQIPIQTGSKNLIYYAIGGVLILILLLKKRK